VIYFTSICGGLPAPQHNNNPFGYKVSWSPRGVLLAGRNNATFFREGKKIQVDGKNLYDQDVFQKDKVGDIEYEWYPNRDSTTYAEIYNIPEAKTLIRGTYRNLGWCQTLKLIAEHGFNSTDVAEIGGLSYAKFTSRTLGGGDNDAKDIKTFTATKLGVPVDDSTIQKFEWLGLFEQKKKVPKKVNTPLDAICHLMQEKMGYAADEKDMLLMKHTFKIQNADGKVKTITSSLIDFGQQPEGESSMARTVTLPVAVAVRAILEGRLNLKPGLVRPNQPEIYNLILKEMEELGVKFIEAEE